MRICTRYLTLVLGPSLLIVSSIGWSQTVEWSNGRVQGTGCRAADTSIFPYGDEISFVFSALGINLSESGGAKASNKFCNISADARVAPGNYVADFQQILTYGGIKSQWGSQGSIMTSAHFFGHLIKPFRIDLPNGTDFDQALISQTLSDKDTPVARAAWWCRSDRSPKGQLMGRIAVNGQLLGPDGGSIALSAQGFDVKYAALIRWDHC